MKNSTLFLLTALAGGVLAAPVAVRAQSVPPPPAPPSNPRDPIIPDSQFDPQIPSLDPELDRPLEPLEPPVPLPVPAPPVLSPFPPVPGPVEDAPLGDSELATPLIPLEGFEVLPTATEQSAAATQEAPPVRYTLTVEGLAEIELEQRFRDLSALEEARGEAVNGAQIELRAREDETLAVRLLRSEGYYDAVARSAVVPASGPEGQLGVTITIAPGPRYQFGDIAITGTDPQSSPIARAALQLETGAPIVATAVEAAEANVLLRLPQEGYPFTTVQLRDIVLDPDTRRGDYTLPVDTGPRASFRGIRTEGDLAFELDHVELLARFDRDRLYDRRLVDDLREAMIATRLFSTVATEPVRTGEIGPDGTEYVDILVTQDAGPSRSLDASIGYATGEGLRIEGAWENRNFFRPEGSLRAAAVLGTNEQSVLARLRFNNWGLRDQSLLFQFEVGRRDYAAFEGYTARLLGLVSRESTPIWQKRWTYSYGAELLATNESQMGAPRIAIGDAYFIGGLIGSVGYDRSNSLLDPTRGFRLLARVNPEASLRDGTDFYLRTQLDASAYYPIGEQLVIAGRARFGSIAGIERDRLLAMTAGLEQRHTYRSGGCPLPRGGRGGFRPRSRCRVHRVFGRG